MVYSHLMRKTLIQLILFGLVGLMTLVVDVGVTSAIYNILGLPAYIASAAGFLSGFVVNFPLNRKKVFTHSENYKHSLRQQIYLYVFLSIFNLLATSAAVDLLVRTGLLQIEYSKMFVTAIFAIWNFLMFKYFIFSKKKIDS